LSRDGVDLQLEDGSVQVDVREFRVDVREFRVDALTEFMESVSVLRAVVPLLGDVVL
jgi:hypothetical protein